MNGPVPRSIPGVRTLCASLARLSRTTAPPRTGTKLAVLCSRLSSRGGPLGRAPRRGLGRSVNASVAAAVLAAAVAGSGSPLPAAPARPATARPPSPSLAEQLRAARAPAGSPLARLIAAHQDLSRLRPEEARDRRGLPPWLRALWREAHPEATYSAADPTGGYPLVLKEILEWMESHPDLLPGRAAPASPPRLGTRATSGPEQIGRAHV